MIAYLREKLSEVAATIGPGLFVLGYTIGTGSVTTMAASGAEFGMSLTWAVGLSCFFTYILIVGIGRSTIVSGETIITSFKERFGKLITLFLLFSLLLTVLTSVMGITGIVADVVRAWTRPLTQEQTGIPPVYTALVLSALLYVLFWTGSHRFFLKALAVIVAVMGTCFILTMLVVISKPTEVIATAAPALPPGNRGHLILAGMVGTTMASVVIVARTYLVDEQGWSLQDLKEENRDAIISLSLTFLVSMSIIASAAGSMYLLGLSVDNAIDMVRTLEPLAGRFATSIFVTGLVAAGFSSLFPSYVLGPWLVMDYLGMPRDMSQNWVRVFVLAVAATGLVVPVFGGQPVVIMIASQALSPAVMPLIILFTFILLNSRRDEGYRNPLWLNAGLIVAFIFSLFISYFAVLGLADFIQSL